MAKNKKAPYKSASFELYVHWKSVPSIFRGMSPDIMEKVGIEEMAVLPLLRIKTQGEFAQYYNVDPGTLSDWNKVIADKNLVAPFRSNTIIKITENAIASLAINQVKEPTPSGIRVLRETVYGKQTKEELKRLGYVTKEEAIKEFYKIIEEHEPRITLEENDDEDREQFVYQWREMVKIAIDSVYGIEPDTKPKSQLPTIGVIKQSIKTAKMAYGYENPMDPDGIA